MSDRIASAQHEATAARERALMCGDSRLKSEWLRVASTWDQIAREYRTLEEVREKAKS